MSGLRAGGAISHYRIEALLGRGGMGEVHRAVDTKLDRTVAIKLLSVSFARDPNLRSRFLREARSAAALHHPNIVTIFSIEEEHGLDFIVMEYVEGETLGARILRAVLDPSEFLSIGAQVADALAAAHAVGLVHRDIKPANIMVTGEGLAKVLDFGIAKRLTPPPEAAPSETTETQLTDPGLVIGTLAYMSPEQARGEELDARSDIFSLGSTLYEALTGCPPFTGAGVLGMIRALANEEPEPPTRVRPELPADFDLILSRAMAKDREERYQSARDLANVLRGLREGPEREVGVIERPTPPAAICPNNLPVQLTSFVGRRRERADVRRLVEANRMVTVTGPGGSGKSRLALQIAADLQREYPDGVWLVELATLDDPAFVSQSVARVLGVQEAAETEMAEALSKQIGDRRILLVLDSCEHLSGSVSALTQSLLGTCRGLRILATSREALGFGGEIVWRVPMLSVPDVHGPDVWTRAAVERYEAVQLFVDRARAVQPSFALTDRTAGKIAQICHRLDGIPLAIELAAVRVKALPLGAILTRLENRFQLLTGGSRTALPRHQTLRAAIDWSYEHLSPREAATLNRLAAFAGWFALDAVSEVCPGGEILEAEVLDLVTALVDKSLVVPEEAEEGPGRFRLLDTIREYGAEKLHAAGESAEVSRRHGAYYLALGETAEPELRGPDQVVWLNRLEAEHDNLRAAVRGFVERAEPNEGLRLAGALWRFWWVRGYWAEGRKRLGEVLSMPGASEPAGARAKALHAAAVLARGQGGFKVGEDLLRESLSITKRTGDKSATADALFELGNIANEREELATAKSLYEESLGLRRELGDERGASYALHNLGVIAHAQGDASAARAIYEEALTLHRKLGNPYLEANTLDGLGDVALFQGDLAAAQEYQEQSLSIQRELGDKRGRAVSLRLLGRIAVREGRFETGRARLLESLEILVEIGDQEGLADALESFAELSAAAGDAERALRLAGAAAAHREAISVPLSRPDRELLERSLEVARAALDGGATERAFAAGRALGLDRALAEVRS